MPYKTIGMLHDGGLQKDINSGVAIVYFNEAERAKYEIVVNYGLVCSARGGVLDTGSSGNKMFIFVMTAEGKIYSADKNEVKHHSSFMSGRPVAAAGCWKVEDGVIKLINGESGHYQPTKDFLDQFVKELKNRKAKMNDVELRLGMTSKQIEAAMRKRGVAQRMRLYTPAKPEWQYL
jgi:hypothetical protein